MVTEVTLATIIMALVAIIMDHSSNIITIIINSNSIIINIRRIRIVANIHNIIIIIIIGIMMVHRMGHMAVIAMVAIDQIGMDQIIMDEIMMVVVDRTNNSIDQDQVVQ